MSIEIEAPPERKRSTKDLKQGDTFKYNNKYFLFFSGHLLPDRV